MGDGTGIPRGRVVALGIALVLVAGSAVWAGSGLVDRNDAANQLTRDRATLRLWRAAAADATHRVDAEEAGASTLVSQIGDASSAAETVAQLDEQELALVGDALAAFPGANVGAYNGAVNARNALDLPHDITVAVLRAKVGALVAALDALKTGQVGGVTGQGA
jgi:hypothetical protein